MDKTIAPPFQAKGLTFWGLASKATAFKLAPKQAQRPRPINGGVLFCPTSYPPPWGGSFRFGLRVKAQPSGWEKPLV